MTVLLLVGVLGVVAGERDEHVVEGGAAQPDVVDLDAAASSSRMTSASSLAPPVTGTVILRVCSSTARSRPCRSREHLAGGVDVVALVHDDLDALAADLRLELVGGAAGDDLAVVDDADVVREAVGLLQVLRGEQQRRAARDQLLDDLPQQLPVARVEAGGRLVHEHHRRRDDQRGRQVEPAAHAAGVGLRGAVGGVGEVEPLQQLDGPPLRVPGRHLVELADHLQVLAAGQVFVDGRELAGQADRAAHLVRVLEHVDARDDGAPAVGLQQGGQDADGGRLAGAVRPEQAEHGAFGHVEVDAVQRPYVTEGLDQTFGIDGAWHTTPPVSTMFCSVGSGVLGLGVHGSAVARGRPVRPRSAKPTMPQPTDIGRDKIARRGLRFGLRSSRALGPACDDGHIHGTAKLLYHRG